MLTGEPTDEQLQLIRTRKPEAPVIEVEMGDGSKKKLWCTFGPQQIDIDPFSKPGETAQVASLAVAARMPCWLALLCLMQYSVASCLSFVIRLKDMIALLFGFVIRLKDMIAPHCTKTLDRQPFCASRTWQNMDAVQAVHMAGWQPVMHLFFSQCNIHHTDAKHSVSCIARLSRLVQGIHDAAKDHVSIHHLTS